MAKMCPRELPFIFSGCPKESFPKQRATDHCRCGWTRAPFPKPSAFRTAKMTNLIKPVEPQAKTESNLKVDKGKSESQVVLQEKAAKDGSGAQLDAEGKVRFSPHDALRVYMYLI